MCPSASSISTIPSSALLTVRQYKALQLLHEAAEAASREGLNIWQFAVEIDQLRVLGLSHTDLRCLLRWDYLQHAWECTTVDASERLFKPLATLVLPKRTCFVLTAKGQEVASDYATRNAARVTKFAEEACSIAEAPRWDGEACQLWWGKDLIKEFNRPAANQELVLAALQEEGWPRRIDDPLPPRAGIDPKARLHDTIKALNRHHLHRIIHFIGDGKGRGVEWILVKLG